MLRLRSSGLSLCVLADSCIMIEWFIQDRDTVNILNHFVSFSLHIISLSIKPLPAMGSRTDPLHCSLHWFPEHSQQPDCQSTSAFAVLQRRWRRHSPAIRPDRVPARYKDPACALLRPPGAIHCHDHHRRNAGSLSPASQTRQQHRLQHCPPTRYTA